MRRVRNSCHRILSSRRTLRQWSLCLLAFIMCFDSCVPILSNHKSSLAEELFYIYDWPEITSALGTQRSDGESTRFYANSGAGVALDESQGIYDTDQYQLFLLMYGRALNDARRTMDPDKATTFFIPYDLATDCATIIVVHLF